MAKSTILRFLSSNSPDYGLFLNGADSCPIYLQLLFVIVFAFLAFLILNWTMSVFRNPHLEGFTYKPSSLAPNTTVSFSQVDLVTDASSICEFLKIDNQLVKSDPSNASFVKSDYAVPKTSLQIDKMYSVFTTSSGTSNALTEALDGSYGNMFDTKYLESLRPQDISAQWLSMNAIKTDDALYNTVKLFVIQSDVANGGKCASADRVDGLSNYFLQSIIKHQSNSAALQELKQAYYAVIKPRFVANKLSNIYWENSKSFTNSDKGSNDSIIYVINTFGELVNSPTLAADLSANGAANIVAPGTPFPNKDPIQIYQTVSVVYELCKFVNKFRELGESAKIKTDAKTFYSGYPEYLKKANQTEPSSPFLFILKNPPDENDCPSTTVLQNGLSSILY